MIKSILLQIKALFFYVAISYYLFTLEHPVPAGVISDSMLVILTNGAMKKIRGI